MESRDAQLAPVRAGCNTISDSRNQPSGNKLTRPISAGLNDGSNDHNYTGPKDWLPSSKLVTPYCCDYAAGQATYIIDRDDSPQIAWRRISNRRQKIRLRNQPSQDTLSGQPWYRSVVANNPTHLVISKEQICTSRTACDCSLECCPFQPVKHIWIRENDCHVEGMRVLLAIALFITFCKGGAISTPSFWHTKRFGTSPLRCNRRKQIRLR